jgi:hypothetical protein
MAADNDLEAAAIADLNELEGIQLADMPIAILVILDRHNAYDMTNTNWTDTRVYEVTSDPNGVNATIVSKRLDCSTLGLSKDSETELNLADPLVLSRFIDFAQSEYPAGQYALFIWGHGTGWRGGAYGDSPPAPLKAIAIDDTSSQYMALSSFGQAVSGKGLSLIAFDTCYAALLEVAYQIRNDAGLFVGSEGEILSTGWEYTALFEDFLQKPGLTVSALGDSIQDQFSAQYAGLSNATISQIALSGVDTLFTTFNDFTGLLAESITTGTAKNAALNELLQSVESYYFTSFPADLYIDIFDFSKKMVAVRTSITADSTKQAAIVAAGNDLQDALSMAIPASWAHNGTTKKMGVHVIPLQGIAVPASSHELAYVRGSMAIAKSAFVEDSSHWVPNAVPQNDSLLDKLFYWTY